MNDTSTTPQTGSAPDFFLAGQALLDKTRDFGDAVGQRVRQALTPDPEPADECS